MTFGYRGSTYQVRKVVPPAFATSANALFISVVLKPDKPTQYAFPLSDDSQHEPSNKAQEIITYPTTVYFDPFRENRVPFVLMNPAFGGGSTMRVGVGGVVVVAVTGGGLVVAGLVETVPVAVPGMHWE